MSTPFDLDAVDLLRPLVPAFKISSSDITNYPLLKKISKTKKPILLSTGASDINEIKNAVNILKKGTKKIVVMHCILNYPTKDDDANLNMILDLKRNFPNFILGYSDHTLPDKNMLNLTSAFLLGAKVIEKHFTLNKKLKGNDHYHAMNFIDLKNLSKNLKKISKILGVKKNKQVLKSEFKSRKFARRSIVALKNLRKGKVIQEKDLITLRPNSGISAIFWKKIIGKRARKNLKKQKSILWSDIY